MIGTVGVLWGCPWSETRGYLQGSKEGEESMEDTLFHCTAEQRERILTALKEATL